MRQSQRSRLVKGSEITEPRAAACRIPSDGNAAKLRVWRGCRGCRAGRCAECVGAESSAGEEAEAGPFAELGEHVAGLDAELQGKFVAAPWPGGLAVHDGGDELPPGGWLERAGRGGRVAAAPGSAGAQGRGAHGDADRGNGSGGPGAAVV